MEKSKLVFILVFFQNILGAFWLVPLFFGKNIMPGDPSEYTRFTLSVIKEFGPFWFFEVNSQTITIPYSLILWVGAGSLGVVIFNSLVIYYAFRCFEIFYSSFFRKNVGWIFILIFFLANLSMVIWQSQFSKEPLAFCSVFFLVFGIASLHLARINAIRLCKTDSDRVKNWAYRILFLGVAAALLSRPYLIPIVVIIFFVLNLPVVFKSRSILFCLIGGIFVSWVSLLAINTPSSNHIVSMLESPSAESYKFHSYGSFGSSPETRSCASAINNSRYEAALTTKLLAVRCSGYFLKGSQGVLAVENQFAPLVIVDNEMLQWLVFLHQSFTGAFRPTIPSLVFSVLDEVSPTLLLMVPIQVAFFTATIGYFIFFFIKGQTPLVSGLMRLGFSLFLVKIIFAFFEVHATTAFRYSHPFSVIFVLNFVCLFMAWRRKI